MSEREDRAAGTGQPLVVAFPEHVGGSEARQIGEELLAAFASGAAVVIADMSATVSCDGACVDALTWACQAAARQAELRLVATAPAIRRLLADRDLGRLVAVYSSVAAAVAAGQLDEAAPAGKSGQPSSAPPRPQGDTPVPGDAQGARMLTRAMLEQLIDALADGILLTDEVGQIVLANRQAAVMFGYRPGELAGQPVESLVPAGLRDAHRRDRTAYARKPVARPMSDRARLAGLRRDGTTIPVTITLSPVPTASGHFVLAVARDAAQQHWQDDFTGLVRSVLAEQAQHAEDLLDQIGGNLLHVGLSLEQAAGQPAELARQQIGHALQRLDDTIHAIRDYVFRSRPSGGTAW